MYTVTWLYSLWSTLIVTLFYFYGTRFGFPAICISWLIFYWWLWFVWYRWMLINVFLLITIHVPPWNISQNCISEGTTGMNAFIETGQRLPIGRIGGGIRTDLNIFKVVAKRTIKFWLNYPSYWFQCKVNWSGMSCWYPKFDAKATAYIPYWQKISWYKLWWSW